MEVDRFFDEQARARVADAVRRAEALSRGQIVPAVVGRSDAYPEARFRGALLGAAVVTGLVLLLELPLTLVELPVLQAAGGLLGALLALLAPVEAVLVGRHAREEAVRARALRAFHEHGLHRTAEGTGVLVFASLREHRAVVLGDHAIHEHMRDGEWDRAVAVLADGLRRHDPAGAFIEAVAVVGAKLAEHFPRASGAAAPANELEDSIRVEPT